MDIFSLIVTVAGAGALTSQLFRLVDKIEQPRRRGRREARKERRA